MSRRNQSRGQGNGRGRGNRPPEWPGILPGRGNSNGNNNGQAMMRTGSQEGNNNGYETAVSTDSWPSGPKTSRTSHESPRSSFGQHRGSSDGTGGSGAQSPNGILSRAIVPAPDPSIAAVENSTIGKARLSLEAHFDALTLEDSFPKRPAYGTQGRSVNLYSNYFAMSPSPRLTLHRYRVIFLDDQDSKPVGRKVHRLIEILLNEHFPNLKASIASDFKSTLISTSELSFRAKTNIRCASQSETEESALERQTYKVEIQYIGELKLQHLHDYLVSTDLAATCPVKAETIQALDIIFGHFPKSSPGILSIGANIHCATDLKTTASYSLGAGLEAVRGYFVSIRPATARLLANVQVKNLAFYEAGSLCRTIRSFLDENHQSQEKLDVFLRNVRVQVEFMSNPGKSSQSQARTITRTIDGLASPFDGERLKKPRVPKLGADSKTVLFWTSNPSAVSQNKTGNSWAAVAGRSGGQSPAASSTGGRYISVYEYFQKVYNRQLSDPALPVINVGSRQNPVYLPAEICTVISGQSAKRQLSAIQTSKMISFAVRNPNHNADAIVTEGARVLGMSPLCSTLKNFNISVIPNLVTVPARVLPYPEVKYGRSQLALTRNGGWNVQSNTLYDCSQLLNWSYLWISLDGAKDPWNNDEGHFLPRITSLRDTLKRLGIEAAPPTLPGYKAVLKPGYKSNPPQDNDALTNAFDKITKISTSVKSPPLILVILPSSDANIYNRVKYLGDVKYGLHTICVIGKKFATATPQYLANLGLKINLKLGGTNQQLVPSKLGIINDNKTMVVGIDVTHPSPNSASNAPSIAGVVASVDSALAQWPGVMRLQRGREEMVDALEEMMISRLNLWAASRSKTKMSKPVFSSQSSSTDGPEKGPGEDSLPENILVYRDGVSEGQYSIVLNTELPKIRSACRKIYPPQSTLNGLPRISIIIVGKRHHTRFYAPVSDPLGPSGPKESRGTDSRQRGSQRPPSGFGPNSASASKGYTSYSRPSIASTGNPLNGTIVDRGVTESRNWDFFLQAHMPVQGTARPAHYFVVWDEIFRNVCRSDTITPSTVPSTALNTDTRSAVHEMSNETPASTSTSTSTSPPVSTSTSLSATHNNGTDDGEGWTVAVSKNKNKGKARARARATTQHDSQSNAVNTFISADSRGPGGFSVATRTGRGGGGGGEEGDGAARRDTNLGRPGQNREPTSTGTRSNTNAADALETLTHNMCYLFGRATKAVSIVPPAYYADILCERGRCYLEKMYNGGGAAAGAAASGGTNKGERDTLEGEWQRESKTAEDKNVHVHERLRESMFYI